ncbi:esterase [Cytophagales bacterium WSM2-2]|nr:esterase [Cytophagales bacterium WSM2-2]
MKHLFVLVVICGLISHGVAQNIPYGNNSKVGKYAEVNGIQLYYEIYGSGPALVLLHGNGGSIAGRASMMPKLSEKYTVIAIDSRCHGKSGCSKELNYEMMASDVNGLLNQLKIDSAYVYGHSDGGIIGLIMAYTYPAKIKRLVTTGANVTPDKGALEPVLVDLMKGYPVLPDTLMRKHMKLMVEHPNIDFKKLSSIKAPVMIVSGDRDAVLLEHSIKIFRAIPKSNLCVLPASSHFVPDEKPSLLIFYLNEFFFKNFTKPSTVEWAEGVAKQMGLKK